MVLIVASPSRLQQGFPISSSAFVSVGVDIAKKKFDAAGLQDGKYRHKVFDNTPEGFAALVAWLTSFGPAPIRVTLEATGAYSVPLAEFLADQGLWGSVVNSWQIRAFAKSELCRAKTDPADATLIARSAQERQPALLESTATHDPRTSSPAAPHRTAARGAADGAQSPGRRPGRHPGLDPGAHRHLEQELTTLRATIRQKIDDDPEVRGRRDLLNTIPGLGEATIAHLLVLFIPHYGFHSAKQVVACVGLARNPYQSGNAIHTRLSKVGDALLRKILFMLALVAWKYNPIVRAFCERLKANGKSGKAVACAAIRKRLHIAFGVIQSGKPFDPHYVLAN
ncbi:IS110 family transposase [Methylolobus aquaticus]